MINFTLSVDEFGVQFNGKYHTLHLKSAHKHTYKVKTNWEGKLYILIIIKWGYINRTIKLSIPRYVKAYLQKFQHPTPTIPQYLTYTWVAPTYGASIKQSISPRTSLMIPNNKQTNYNKL